MNRSLHYDENACRLHAVSEWLMRSHKATGYKGFSIGFDLRRGWLASYSETTGYIIPTFYRYATLYDRHEYAAVATAAARWLVSIQSADGSFPDFGGRHANPYLRPPVIFNTAQDIFGLLAAYRMTGDIAFVDAALRAGRWISRRQSSNGVWHNPGWGGVESPSYYSRVTWPLQLVATETSDDEISVAAHRGLDAIINRIRPNNSVGLWEFARGQPAFTHTIAYTIEGLLEHGLLIEDASITQRAKSIAVTTLELLEQSGVFAGAYDDKWQGHFGYICTPGNCQLALIYLRLYFLEREERYLHGAERALKPVLKAQFISSFVPKAIRGGLPGSWPPVFGKYMRWLYPNWAAKYLADSLMFRAHAKDVDTANNQSSALPDLLRLFPG
jgi:hypothetical protein